MVVLPVLASDITIILFAVAELALNVVLFYLLGIVIVSFEVASRTVPTELGILISFVKQTLVKCLPTTQR